MLAGALLLLAVQAAAATPGLAPGDTPPADWRAGEWIEVHAEANLVVSLDETATRRDGDRVRLRIRALLDPAQYEGARFGLAEMEVDCRRRTVRGITMTEYDAAGAMTRQDRPAEALATQPWPEGDPVAETFAAACHRTGWGEE